MWLKKLYRTKKNICGYLPPLKSVSFPLSQILSGYSLSLVKVSLSHNHVSAKCASYCFRRYAIVTVQIIFQLETSNIDIQSSNSDYIPIKSKNEVFNSPVKDVFILRLDQIFSRALIN